MIREIESFLAAFRGILFAAKNERHFRFHLFATIVVCIAGYYFEINPLQWLAVINCVAIVTVTEIFNSSIEKLTDMVSPNYNKQAGIVKDLAAGGVLIAAIISAIVGGLIFIPFVKQVF